jgi:hypothetical protein
MVEGRVVVDREHVMTSHPIRRGSGNVLTHLVMAALGAGLAARLLLALDIPARRFQPAIATDNATTDSIVFPFTVAWDGVEKAKL